MTLWISDFKIHRSGDRTWDGGCVDMPKSHLINTKHYTLLSFIVEVKANLLFSRKYDLRYSLRILKVARLAWGKRKTEHAHVSLCKVSPQTSKPSLPYLHLPPVCPLTHSVALAQCEGKDTTLAAVSLACLPSPYTTEIVEEDDHLGSWGSLSPPRRPNSLSACVCVWVWVMPARVREREGV